MSRKIGTLLLVILAVAAGCQDSKQIVEDYAQGVVINAPNTARKTKMTTDLRQIRVSIDFFFGQHGRYPENLQELARKGTMQRIPREPLGGRWVYDSATGQIHSSSFPEL